MQRRDVALGLMGLPSAIALGGRGEAQVAADTLTRQVRQLAERYAAAWNASDMKAMAALYTPGVHWVNIVGMHWQGREEVDYAHRSLFDRSFRGVTSTLEDIESVAPLPGGGAVAVVRWAVGPYQTPSGQMSPASRTRMSLVLLPGNDGLLIAHGANIEIVEPAQRSDPVRQRRESRPR